MCLSRLGSEERQTLGALLTKQELLSSIEALKTAKSPGGNGIPAEFYKAFVGLLADKLVKLYMKALEKLMFFDIMREALIVMIPKLGKDPLEMKSYLPLSMLNVDQKLLSHVLASRYQQSPVCQLFTEEPGHVRDGYLLLRSRTEEAEVNAQDERAYKLTSVSATLSRTMCGTAIR
ncbi:hypothetical protein NDU88_002860 [Pleurodeles waltl]|uniref:Uncharacterized protein n=1 Tax=Pleurodeles waltl TaxID=8319 RepID=A0AAV7M780_PLEWA|nr:hypothetical protein NDU88_002860 [Pleurodeles waltl]